MARGCNSAVDALLCWIDFSEHDELLNSTRGKRITTNCASLWAYVQDTRPDLAEEFITLVQNPGSAAHQAILDFSAAIISWLRPKQHTLTGLLLAGITYQRHTHAAAEAKDLVKIAVRSSDVEIDITAISRTGHYTRELCGAGNIADDAGFTDFDPSTDIGRLRWSQVNRLILARFRQPPCKLTELRTLRTDWSETLQGFETADRFFSQDEEKYEKLAAAGGAVPDNLRIEMTRERLAPDMIVAFNAFEEMEVARGCYDTDLENNFAAFSAAVIRVGISLTRRQSQRNAQSPGDAAPAAAQAGLSASDDRARQLRFTQGDNSCWKWSVGECSYGDNCRFEHVGEAGSQRGTVVDEDGQCLMFSRRGQCTRKKCPFGHNENTAAAAAEDTPAANATQSQPPARRVFTVLHQDKAEKTRKLREHSVSSEGFVAPGTRTADGDLKPRWTRIKDIPEDDSDCGDY